MKVNYSVAFWVLLIILLLLLIAALIMGIVQSYKIPHIIDSKFRIKNQTSQNHLGETSTVTYVVHLSYSGGVSSSKVADRAGVTNVINTSPPLTTASDKTAWEFVAKDIGTLLYKNYDCYGVSVEIIIPETSEDAGKNSTVVATYTKGYVDRAVKIDTQ
jgi:hypothetical protein